MPENDSSFQRDRDVIFDPKTGKPYYYPEMEHGFPRRYVDTTPQEILYDPQKILGGYGVEATLTSEGRTILVQPRRESTAYISEERVDIRPPRTQVPYVKRQTHLDPSRNAEHFFRSNCTDVPASGIAPGLATVISLDTFNNMRTLFRWVDLTIFDALNPSGIALEFRVEGVPRKYLAAVQARAITQPSPFSTNPGGIDISRLPDDFQNFLLEVTDQRRVDIVVTNTVPAIRTVCVSVWGWTEDMTRFDDAVLR